MALAGAPLHGPGQIVVVEVAVVVEAVSMLCCGRGNERMVRGVVAMSTTVGMRICFEKRRPAQASRASRGPSTPESDIRRGSEMGARDGERRGREGASRGGKRR